jgi:hypothetical protein
MICGGEIAVEHARRIPEVQLVRVLDPVRAEAGSRQAGIEHRSAAGEGPTTVRATRSSEVRIRQGHDLSVFEVTRTGALFLLCSQPGEGERDAEEHPDLL